MNHHKTDRKGLTIGFMDFTVARHPFLFTLFRRMEEIGYRVEEIPYWDYDQTGLVPKMLAKPPFHHLADAFYGYPKSKLSFVAKFCSFIAAERVSEILKKRNVHICFTSQWFPGISKAARKAGAKSVVYGIDEPFHYSKTWHDYVLDFDIILTSSLKAADYYRDRGGKAYFFPLFADPSYFYPVDVKKKYDLAFAGRDLIDRRTAFNRFIMPLIRFYGPRLHLFGFDAELPCSTHEPVAWYKVREVYSATRVNLNIHREGARQLWDSVNSRTFEVLACRSFLITDDALGITRLFENKKEIVVAKDGTEMVELSQYYLENEDEREKIASRGYDKIMRNHTAMRRALELDTIVRKIA
jgi:hypothetical protein